MSEETTTTTTQAGADVQKSSPRRPYSGRGGSSSRKPRRERPKPDFEQKIISIRRVTRVVAGGRRFSFSVAMVIGDKNGGVGIGLGKAGDTALAIQKAINQAKRDMVIVDLTETKSIPYEISAKYNSARVMLMPNKGRGVVAGSAVRTVLELAGMKDVTSKVMSRTKNQINIARATIKALAPISRPFQKKAPVTSEKKETAQPLSAEKGAKTDK